MNKHYFIIQADINKMSILKKQDIKDIILLFKLILTKCRYWRSKIKPSNHHQSANLRLFTILEIIDHYQMFVGIARKHITRTVCVNNVYSELKICLLHDQW